MRIFYKQINIALFCFTALLVFAPCNTIAKTNITQPGYNSNDKFFIASAAERRKQQQERVMKYREESALERLKIINDLYLNVENAKDDKQFLATYPIFVKAWEDNFIGISACGDDITGATPTEKILCRMQSKNKNEFIPRQDNIFTAEEEQRKAESQQKWEAEKPGREAERKARKENALRRNSIHIVDTGNFACDGVINEVSLEEALAAGFRIKSTFWRNKNHWVMECPGNVHLLIK